MFFKNRKHSRESVSGECRVESVSGNWAGKGRVLNISDSGMGLELDEELQTREKLTLYMTGDSGEEMQKKAVIAWYINKIPPDKGTTLGLKFV
ncbi:MAG: PilZ domain-containing protein [Pseudomonadota bacterium]